MAENRHSKGGSGAESLDDYVNDRPPASSSMTAVALGQVFRTSMTGRCDARPELAGSATPIAIALTAVRAKGGAEIVRRLFEPLGWNVSVEAIPLNPEYPGWGDSHYVYLWLTGTMCLATALRQIHALLTVLDDSNHYWVGDDEITKLFRAGVGWLAGHPEKELIMTRYLAHQRDMVAAAASLMVEGEGGSAEGKKPGPDRQK